jgi:P pilus assembly chaperone PapD
MKIQNILLACAFASAVAIHPQSMHAQNLQNVGTVMVAPTRLILGSGARTGELSLVNTGTARATYRIGLTHMRMNENGGITEVTNPSPEEKALEQLVRFSPRQVELEPQVAQTVRVQFRPQPGLAAGEYRVNLIVQAIPESAPIEEKKGDGLSVQIATVYGVSVPVIIRVGETSASARLSGLAIESAKGLQFRIERSGNRSVFGHLTAKFTPAGGKERVVGSLRGIAVYPQLDARNVTMALAGDASLGSGKLELTYVDGEGSGELLARTTLALP